MGRQKKNPLLTAAVIKTSLSFRGEGAEMYRVIYEGVLRDFGLSDAEVDAYIERHRDEVVRLARGHSAPPKGGRSAE
ncbi:MAG: hypothetical protein D6729_08035 [Deltaproteobacteria bacterium]|nr:MAG: hypothetical protein D6729_08035 [Deltaproteobacteria bacterium]